MKRVALLVGLMVLCGGCISEHRLLRERLHRMSIAEVHAMEIAGLGKPNVWTVERRFIRDKQLILTVKMNERSEVLIIPKEHERRTGFEVVRISDRISFLAAEQPLSLQYWEPEAHLIPAKLEHRANGNLWITLFTILKE
ncbi:MAG: hypothetical protein COU08_04655 [Candidatus Harrisonbacteria bacterium CG10_big_fil_rev_8_21_14_0_10_42_17]|uniref:Uncharacterized protein n=1 Tax=Candidatus Harrisonbacteria bacterium CG10_big_fil_rev_8_21_14_0_10_42_17 TaxID=1974584 RepID=A0A2M6WH47_9BACT|nr:MAG: hypothetical protein COU08_04655 [Candidatus Harrisonbacteria bacterium CG10_big_fil_rev_8_21_14_0_10_42_17]